LGKALTLEIHIKMSKIHLILSAKNGGPFNCLPCREVALEPERVLCNDVVFPWESHPRRPSLYVIGNEFGALGAVWADHESEAFDTLVDENLGAGLLIPEDDADEESDRLGNAGEPANLDHAWVQKVRFDPSLDVVLIVRFAEARAKTLSNLSQD
jgi:hypothetical protein